MQRAIYYNSAEYISEVVKDISFKCLNSKIDKCGYKSEFLQDTFNAIAFCA